jgi:superkiller protein 3
MQSTLAKRARTQKMRGECGLQCLGAQWIAACCLALAFSTHGFAQSTAPADSIRSGAQQLHAGDYAGAERSFRAATEAAPESGEAHLDLGLVLIREGKRSEAVDELKTAARLSPQTPGIQMFLGISYYQLHRLDEAIGALNQELELNHENAEALMWLGIVELANGDAEKAVAPLDRAAALSPKDLNILDYRAQAHSQVASDSFARMRQLDPDSWHVHRARAQNFADLGQPQQAIREYQAAIEKQPQNADLYEGLGTAYLKMSNSADAAHAFVEELKLNPGNPVALYNLGRIKVENGDAAAGVPLLEKAVPTLPNPAPGYFYLGLGLVRTGHDTEAVSWFEKSLAAKPSAFIEQSAWFQLARLYQRLHRDQDAQHAVAELKRLKAQNTTQPQAESGAASPR